MGNDANTPDVTEPGDATRRTLLRRASGILAPAGPLRLPQLDPGSALARSARQRRRRKHRRKKTVALCLDYQTITVARKQQANYLNEGATQGACTCLPPTQDLRAAIDAAAPSATLTLCPGIWQFADVIDRTNAILSLPKNLRVIGAGSERTILSGKDANIHGMIVDRQAVVHVEGRTLTEFRAAYESGSGIYNNGSLTLVDVVISRCGIVDNNNDGVGIYNTGNMSLDQCTVFNCASEGTGGIANLGAATLTNCRVTNNHNGGPGGSCCGGIGNSGTMTLIETLVADNMANNGAGGGIVNGGMLTLDRSHVTRNTATNRHWEPREFQAGGIFNGTGGAVVLKPGSTVMNNSPRNRDGPGSPVAGCID